MKKDYIDILIPNSKKDSTGRLVTSYLIDSTIYDSIQTFKYNVGFNPFGITDKTNNVVYCHDLALMDRYLLTRTDPKQFNATYRIGYNNNQYIINCILPYKRHMEIYLELVI